MDESIESRSLLSVCHGNGGCCCCCCDPVPEPFSCDEENRRASVYDAAAGDATVARRQIYIRQGLLTPPGSSARPSERAGRVTDAHAVHLAAQQLRNNFWADNRKAMPDRGASKMFASRHVSLDQLVPSAPSAW
uniref:Uncharacterized protein n=1 Tax=Anopheles atroparvus TaxID=41427 RepID=A0A182JLY9_ANOAO